MKKQSYKAGIVTVANLAGVSPATVSRALNHPDLVNPTTRKKVDAAIRKTGYIRNRAAQAMHGRRSATLGLIVPTVNYSIFAELVQSFNDTVTDLGFTVLLASHGYDLNTEYQVLRKLLEHRVDGIALIGLDHSKDTYRLIASQEVPVIAAWAFAADSPISCIGADNQKAGQIAAAHILSLGHRKIGFVFPPTGENDRARGRSNAAFAAVVTAGHAVQPEWIASSLYSIGQARLSCTKLLQQPNRPTALICGNDIIAQGAVSAAFHLGLRIPQDISIIGIGDFAGSADMFPSLTTVRIPAQEIGSQTGQHLVDFVARFDPAQILRIEAEVSLRIGSTTCAITP
jgi:LacI family transcriptional regulator